MKPGFPVKVNFHTGLVLPLLPFFLLGAALLTGSRKTLVAEATRRSQTENLTVLEAKSRGLPYGPCAVARYTDVLLPDIRRGKDLPVTVTAPRSGGPFPVIVFSHSAGGDGLQYEPLFRWWASNGYVVLSPTHSDSLRWQQQRSELCDSDDAEEGNMGLQNIVRLTLHDPQSGVQRARDVSLVLNSLNTLEEKIPALVGKMDRDHVGIAGHSLGACTAQIVGDAAIFVPGQARPLSFGDRRAHAILQLSGQGSGLQGMTKESWKNIKIPMMIMTGSEDRSIYGRGPEWEREPFDYSAADGNKYLVFIQGAHSGSFSGRFAGRGQKRPQFASLAGGEGPPSASPRSDQKAIFCYVEQASLDFWDMTLKRDSAARIALTTNAASLAQQNGVTATITHK